MATENDYLKEQERIYKQAEATKAREAQQRDAELARKSEEAERLAKMTRLQEQELEAVKLQLAELSTPIIEIREKEIEVEKVVEIEKIVKDEAEVQRLKTELEKKAAQHKKDVEAFEAAQNDLAVLAERNKQLNEESRRNFAETHAIVGRLRIRQEWQFATSEIYGNHQKFEGRIPSAIDREAFEGEEHARTRQCIEVMEHTIDLLKQTLPQASSNMVEASRVLETSLAYIESGNHAYR